jgi:hypothetical protein
MTFNTQSSSMAKMENQHALVFTLPYIVCLTIDVDIVRVIYDCN